MKTAKELFKELGYKVIDDDEINIQYKKENKFTNHYIVFWKNSKTFYKGDNDDISVEITLDELKAINKQVEEIYKNE